MTSQIKLARISQIVDQNYSSWNVNDYIRRKGHETKDVTRANELRT
jgi:hypothetical protein